MFLPCCWRIAVPFFIILYSLFLTHSLMAAEGGSVSLPSLVRTVEGAEEVRIRESFLLPPLGIPVTESEGIMTVPTAGVAPRAGERYSTVRFASSGDELVSTRKDMAGLLAKTAERYYKEGKRARAYAFYVRAAQEVTKMKPNMADMYLYADRAAQYYCLAARIAFYVAEEDDETIVELFSKAIYYAELASQGDPHKFTVKAVAYPLRKTMIQSRDSGLRYLANALEGLLTRETAAYALMLSSMRELLTIPTAA